MEQEITKEERVERLKRFNAYLASINVYNKIRQLGWRQLPKLHEYVTEIQSKILETREYISQGIEELQKN